MGRRLEYEVKTSVRLNMSNPQHVKINDVIQNLDPKIFKSKNQFIIDAIQFYIDNYGKETFLREHPQITSIRFCLDRDEPGRKAAAELMRKYYELGYEVEDCPPPAGYKDYNEWLVAAKLNLNQMNQRADEPVRA